MKTFALQILGCILIGVAGLQAATSVLAPIQVSQAAFPDGRGNMYWIIFNGTKASLYIVLPTTSTTPIRYAYLLVMPNSTPAKIIKYLQSKGVKT